MTRKRKHKKWDVTLVCYVPQYGVVTVEAPNTEEAIKLSLKKYASDIDFKPEWNLMGEIRVVEITEKAQ